jgi:hypothetical protein
MLHSPVFISAKVSVGQLAESTHELFILRKILAKHFVHLIELQASQLLYFKEQNKQDLVNKSANDVAGH